MVAMGNAMGSGRLMGNVCNDVTDVVCRIDSNPSVQEFSTCTQGHHTMYALI